MMSLRLSSEVASKVVELISCQRRLNRHSHSLTAMDSTSTAASRCQERRRSCRTLSREISNKLCMVSSAPFAALPPAGHQLLHRQVQGCRQGSSSVTSG